MFRSILAICILAVMPVAVYSASTWPDEPKVDREARRQRKQFFDHLAAGQTLRRERLRRDFDGDRNPPAARHW
ncbi:hypothetical protein [Methylobacterium flocculans]|uniref:hypothetical protein n=1 Tax=Methylobacterium flocculans TaxID=2984843 RepID=UPI0021F3C1C8|nr:hypothetical protein [Methylobacterium sp. FF17]